VCGLHWANGGQMSCLRLGGVAFKPWLLDWIGLTMSDSGAIMPHRDALQTRQWVAFAVVVVIVIVSLCRQMMPHPPRSPYKPDTLQFTKGS